MAPSESASTSADAPSRVAAASEGGVNRSPLEDEHRALGAKLVSFGGWLMPLAYGSGTLAEHMACRTDSVVFDVSHLGTVRVGGMGAFDLLQRELTNDLRKVAPGRAQYTHLLDEADGSVVDDIIVWWLDDGVFDVMPNASNTSRVRDAIGGEDTTAARAVLAVQGPEAAPPARRGVPGCRRGRPVPGPALFLERRRLCGGGDRLHGRGRGRVRRAGGSRHRLLAGAARRRYPPRRPRGTRHAPSRGGVALARP